MQKINSKALNVVIFFLQKKEKHLPLAKRFAMNATSSTICGKNKADQTHQSKY
jgi:hypothetical protein